MDTCTFLWVATDASRLSPALRPVLEDSANELLLSAASGWEISIKHALGRLDLPEAPSLFMARAIGVFQLATLPIGFAHAVRGGELPLHHRDPFDRLLIAQAEIEALPLATPDPAFRPYAIEVMW